MPQNNPVKGTELSTIDPGREARAPGSDQAFLLLCGLDYQAQRAGPVLLGHWRKPVVLSLMLGLLLLLLTGSIDSS